ncbi:hypothetical protein EQH57_0294 [Dictyocoela roeselum]|nr:hypothetical protein EQH57_0294 [Dictyocoela roeselum]
MSSCSESDNFIEKPYESSSSCNDFSEEINREKIGCKIFNDITRIIRHHNNPKGGVRCTNLRRLFERMTQFVPCDAEKYAELIKDDKVFEAYLLLEKHFGCCEKKKCIPAPFYNCDFWRKASFKVSDRSSESSSDDVECGTKGCVNFIDRDCRTYALPLPKKCGNKPYICNFPICLADPCRFFQTSMCEDLAIVKALVANRHAERRDLYEKLKKCLCSNHRVELIHAKFCVIKIFVDILVGTKNDLCVPKYLDILNEGNRCGQLQESKYFPCFRTFLKNKTPILC